MTPGFYFDPDASGLRIFLGPAEARIMEALWEHGPVTVKRLQFLLDPEAPPGYTAVIKVLDRLTARGLVTGERRGAAKWYQATVSREQFLKTAIDRIQRSLRRNFPDFL